MAKSFSEAEWDKIFALAGSRAEALGLPRRRRKSIVLGSFNIRKLGDPANKSQGAWQFLKSICQRFDLLAIQEVQDNLDGIRHLKSLLGPDYGLVVSDATGSYPGEAATAERLAFLFRWRRVSRTEVASDITYDRTKVANTLFGFRQEFWAAFEDHAQDLARIGAENEARRQAGKKKKTAPPMPQPRFLTFIRQPLCVSFEIKGREGAEPYRFLAVNCHLLYGDDPAERRREFEALIAWLIERAKNPERMYYPNILMMGDCNLEFKEPEVERPRIAEFLKSLNEKELGRRSPAEFNFPFLDVHPKRDEVFRTAARLKDTYDQAAIVFRDPRLPDYKQNRVAGAEPDGYDFGVFNFVDLFSQALHGADFRELGKLKQRDLLARFEHDLSDHLPIWIRLPLPGELSGPP